MTILSVLTLLDEVADYLQANTAIGTVAVNIFTGMMPDSPAACTAVYAQGGPIAPGDPVVRPFVQVLTRDAGPPYSTYFASHSRADVIHKALHEKWNVLASIPGRLVAQHEVGPNFRDANNNIVFTLNFSFTGIRGTE